MDESSECSRRTFCLIPYPYRTDKWNGCICVERVLLVVAKGCYREGCSLQSFDSFILQMMDEHTRHVMRMIRVVHSRSDHFDI